MITNASLCNEAFHALEALEESTIIFSGIKLRIASLDLS